MQLKDIPAGSFSMGEERAAMTHVSADGLRVTHDPEKGRIRLPGGGTKFTIRFDATTATYCALVNLQSPPECWRNRFNHFRSYLAL